MSKIPSIAMIPSGYKANKVYSVLPTNGDADLATTRASIATRVDQNGVIEEKATGVPRLDYFDGGCPSLLLEPQSTNLVTYSEEFDNVAWTVFDVTKDPNSVISPDGTLNGCRVTALAGVNRVIQQIVSVTADPSNDRTYTGSIYIKSPNTTSCIIRVGSAASNTSITISDQWQRFDAQYVLGATFTAIRLGLVLENEGDIVDIAFGQVEEQSYPTSYIKTEGATATRVAETVSKTGLSSYINSSEGVLYFESKLIGNNSNNKGISIGDGTVNNRILFYYTSTPNEVILTILNGGSVQVNETLSITNSLVFNKFAIKYKDNDFALWINGVEVATDVSGTLGSGMDNIYFNTGAGLSPFYGKLKDLRVYDTALSDSELQTLTTL